MTTLFAANYANQNARTQGEMKTVFETLRSVLAETLGGSAEVTIALVGDVLTPTNNSCQIAVDSQVGGAGDSINTIAATNCRDGELLLLRCTSTSEPITCVESAGGAGQLKNADAANFILTDPKQFIIYKYNASLGSGTWEEVFRSYANQKAAFRTYLGLGTAATVDTGTTSGTLPLFQNVWEKITTYNANLVVASHASSNGQILSARALVAADLPTVTLAKGGTGATTPTGAVKSILVGAGGSAYKELIGSSAGQSIRVNSGNNDIEFYSPGNSTPFQSTDQTITLGTGYTLAHSLSSTPKEGWWALVCQTAEFNWAVGDVVYYTEPTTGGVIINLDATNVVARVNNTQITVMNKTTGAAANAITVGNWKLRFFAI